MKMAIEIDKHIYERAIQDLPIYPTLVYMMTNAIKNGTPLPKNHGDLVSKDDVLTTILFSKLFDDAKCEEVKKMLQKIPTIIETERSDKDGMAED